MKLLERLKESRHLSHILGIFAVVAVLGTLVFGIFSGPITDQGVFKAEQGYASGGRDLRINKALQGSSNIFNGDTITIGLTILNHDDGADVIAEFIVRDTLPAGMAYANAWTSSIPGSTVSDPVYDPVTGIIEWSVLPLFADESVTITYDVLVSQVGPLKNYAEVIPDVSLPAEDVPYVLGACSSGFNPLNDNEYAVSGTNNIDCETIVVQSDGEDGLCGSDHLQSFYLPNEPQNLCAVGTNTVPQYTQDHGWVRSCIGNNGGDVVPCDAGERFCGDTFFQPNDGEGCEDGNKLSGDGCSSTCEIEGCTDPNAYNFDGSAQVDNGTCRYCGDGLVEPIEGEQCDDGTINNTGTCTPTYNNSCTSCTSVCEIATFLGGICGDGVIQGPEVCDDGNNMGSDGCSQDCTSIDAGWSCPTEGQSCVDDNECVGEGTGNTCHAQAQCTNEPGTFSCTCNTGFMGNGETCIDINECNSGAHSCSDNALCTNIPGGFTCECEAGYSGDGETCVDDNECNGEGIGHTCHAQAQCTNEPGTYSCTCNAGFVGSGVSCIDINECNAGTDSCSDNALCINEPGGFSCECETGYSGDGESCADIDECATGTDSCSEYAQCENTAGLYTCSCDSGYSGDGFTCESTCGDGIVAGNEICDDGNTENLDGCSNECIREIPTCDLTGLNPKSGLLPLTIAGSIQHSPWASIQSIERGNGDSANSTSPAINYTYNTVGAFDLVVTVVHEDNGSITETCTEAIQAATICGNNSQEPGEGCDDGANNGIVCNPGYGDSCSYCSMQCEIETIQGGSCGDGIIQSDEQEICDDGKNTGTCIPEYEGSCQACTTSCSSILIEGGVCGDGVVQGPEECDDANNNEEDDCDSSCNEINNFGGVSSSITQGNFIVPERLIPSRKTADYQPVVPVVEHSAASENEEEAVITEDEERMNELKKALVEVMKERKVAQNSKIIKVEELKNITPVLIETEVLPAPIEHYVAEENNEQKREVTDTSIERLVEALTQFRKDNQ